MPATRDLDGAHSWMRDYADAGLEGVVVKHREHGYRPRRRSWFKVRTRTTADAVVGGVIGPLHAPEALLLGLPDDTGRLRVAGRTSPLTLPARHEFGTLLMPPQRTHPWPERIPASRFGRLPGSWSITRRANRCWSSRSIPTRASTRTAGAIRQRFRGCEQSWIHWTFRRFAATTSRRRGKEP